MYILNLFLQTHQIIPQKKILIQLYCKALHVWLSIPLLSIAMLSSLVVRWQSGLSTTLRYIFKALNGGGMSDLRALPSLSYLKPLPTLQLLCFQTSYRVQFERRYSWFILNAGFKVSKQGFKNIFVTAKIKNLGTFCINIFENLATTQSLLQFNLFILNVGQNV